MIINVCTPSALDPADSFGILALELSRHLTRLGAYVNLFSQGPRRAGPALDAELAAIVGQPIRAATGAIFLGYPTTYATYANPLTRMGPRVGVAMFESTIIPEGFTEALNACQAVVTPSRFCRDIFADAGVTSPITIAPLGLNPLYAYAERPVERPLTFLAFIDRGMRKGGIEAMQALANQISYYDLRLEEPFQVLTFLIDELAAQAVAEAESSTQDGQDPADSSPAGS